MADCWRYLRSKIRTSGGDQRGASVVEYALLLALVVVVCIVAVNVVADQTSENFSSTASVLD